MKLSALALYAQAAYNFPEKYFVRRLSDCVIVSIRGTQSIEDFVTDARFLKTGFLDYRAHEGFVGEFNVIWPAIAPLISPLDPVYITGHSLGGALATLVAMEVKREHGNDPIVATFGSPRVFDPEGALAYNAMCPATTRVVHRWDLVPRIPKIDYQHVEGELHLDDKGRVLLDDDHWLRNLGRIIWSDASGLSLENHHMPTYLDAVFGYELLDN